MKFSSVKHAIGWYVARRKGPAQLRAFDPASRATKTPYTDNSLVFFVIGQLLHYPSPVGLGLSQEDPKLVTLLRWASTSDDAGIEVDQFLLGELAELLESAGLVERVAPPQGGYVEFQDLNSGRVVRTWREKKA